MANYISLEMASGRNKVPAYTPFIAPEMSAVPRAVTSKEPAAAVARWRGSAWPAKREDNPQSTPMQARPLYQLGFLIAADLAGEWPRFGVWPPSWIISIVTNISIAGPASAALSCDRFASEFLPERARSRSEITGPNFPASFLLSGIRICSFAPWLSTLCRRLRPRANPPRLISRN